MDTFTAIAILDGFQEPKDAAEVLAACRWIRDKGPRGILHGSGTTRAIELADYADANGDDAAIDVIEGND